MAEVRTEVFKLDEIDDKTAAGMYRKWRAGACPCCGSDLDWWDQMGTKSAAVAEQVELCGRCIENHHHVGPFGEAMIAAIPRGRVLVEADE